MRRKQQEVPRNSLKFCVNTPIANSRHGFECMLDKAICHAIFGNGKDLYDKFNEVMENVLGAKAVDSGWLNTAKAALKGKTVYEQ